MSYVRHLEPCCGHAGKSCTDPDDSARQTCLPPELRTALPAVQRKRKQPPSKETKSIQEGRRPHKGSLSLNDEGGKSVATVGLSKLVNIFIIQFFRGKDVDKWLFPAVKCASNKALSDLPII